MYVEDIDDLEELEDLRKDAESRLGRNPGNNEQAQWDLEDIEERIEELSEQVKEGV
ncbi:hypothetical protein PBI_JOSHKAYV_77 [Mycobacterium phage JoshKayV]|uniref:Uncharacterized protein n=1 Tax=Mycobacterium phage JoshKayV TaxID=2024294 RepID=A0A249XV66_9CAUD|nr:hypothetical protein KIY86_gp30 [Mycobacterium phage JoshKayV]ASZ75416.1 hypothetical protein PBI_JOSHKAYV_77 [Mycobacterium phage JoshKayV]